MCFFLFGISAFLSEETKHNSPLPTTHSNSFPPFLSLCCCSCCCCVTSVVSDSVRPHRRQPTRLPCPWDSPGKNTGVGCHFLLQCMKVKSKSEVAQSCPTQQPHVLEPTRLLHPWDFPGKSTGMECLCLLQCMKVKSESEVAQSCLTLSDPMDWTATHQTPPSMGFSRQ